MEFTVKLFKHQEKTAEFYARTPRAFNTSDPGCVSADTEFLTPTGWKRIDSYKEGDLVAAYTPETKTAFFETPAAFIKKPCGEMIHFHPARGVEQLLSPEHRVLYQAHGAEKLHVKSAEEIYNKHLKKKNGFSGKVITAFSITNESNLPLSEAELRLQVAVIADGHFSETAKICVIRVKKERKKTRLKKLLESAGINYNETDCKAAKGFTRFSFYAPRRDKEFNEYYYKASPEQLKIIVDEAQHWDGSIDKRGTGSYRFTTTSRQSADFIQYAATGTQRTCTLAKNTRNRTGRKNITETTYNLHIQNKSVPSKLTGRLHSNVSVRPSTDGHKYCFTTSTSFWVMRYNGKVCITGNTGKTLSGLEGFERTKKDNGKMLVLAPLSILQPSWGNDIEKFKPDWNYGIAHGTPTKRTKIMAGNYDVVITNHDAVKWIAAKPELLDGFTHVVVDEFTAFKNRTTQRSKALKVITDRVPNVWMLSGTPNSNSNLDIWFPAFMLDKGERLGRRFFEYRSAVCTPQQNGPDPQHIQWVDKPGAEFDIADRLKDITIRFKAEDCIDLPEHSVSDMLIDMPPWLMKHYKSLLETDVLETENGHVTSFHAGARVRKLLQLLSGAIYDAEGNTIKVHEARYQLVMDLIEARSQTVVAFNYKHERDQLILAAQKRGISFGVIDGDTKVKDRTTAVEAFQRGELKTIFAHPQSAGHGLTLTNGVATIWCSPTYNAEHYQQFNCRIYRNGQTKKTETIRIAYNDSKEIDVYNKLDGKLVRVEDILALFSAFTEAA